MLARVSCVCVCVWVCNTRTELIFSYMFPSTNAIRHLAETSEVASNDDRRLFIALGVHLCTLRDQLGVKLTFCGSILARMSARKSRGCYDDASLKLIPWNLSSTPPEALVQSRIQFHLR